MEGAEEEKEKGSEDGSEDEDADKKEEEGDEVEIDKEDREDRPTHRLKAYEVSADGDEYAPKGKNIVLEGSRVYTTGPPKTQVGVILIGDLYGSQQGRLREIADHIGFGVHACVMVPRLLEDPPFTQGEDGLPDGFDQTAQKDALRPWVLKYTWASVSLRVKAVVAKMRDSKMKRIGIVGFGFGAWVATQTSNLCGECVGSCHFHPEIERFERLLCGNDVDSIMRKIRGNTLFLLPGIKLPAPHEDQSIYREKGFIHTLVKEAGEPLKVLEFPEMKPGWVLAGDVAVPGTRPGVEHAVSVAAKHMWKVLWPPKDGYNAASLRTAARNGDMERVDELVCAGVDFTGPESCDLVGLSPLHYAAREGHTGPIKILLKNGADANQVGGRADETAVHIAAQHNHARAIKLLVDGRADITLIDKAGQTGLHWAAKSGSLAAVKVLLEKGAQIDVVDTALQTCLHLAAFFGSLKVVQHLLDANMDIDPEDLRGQRPWDRANTNGFTVVADVLLSERERRHGKIEEPDEPPF